MTCSPLINVPGTTIIKELVTNLTDNENLIKPIVLVSANAGTNPTYIKKYSEGGNTVFVFQFSKAPDYTAMGAGAGLAAFIAKNWNSIAVLLAMAGITIWVWMWRDAATKGEEVKGALSDNANNEINKILGDSTLSTDQKAALIAQILKTLGTPTDWGTTALGIGGILGLAYVAGEFMKNKKKSRS